MIINAKDISIIRYSTSENWVKNLPNANWLCILLDNNRSRNYLNEVISKLIHHDVCYVCTIGKSCEKTHDLVDEEIIFRVVDIENPYLPKHSILTTWHTDFEEGIHFAIFSAQHERVLINKIVLLDMTEGAEISRINKLLDNYVTS